MPFAVQQVVDLREPRVDPDGVGAGLLEQVLAERAAAVHLDDEPAEVAQLRLARAQQHLLLAAEHAGVRAPRSDALDLGGGHLVPAAAKRRHAVRV